MPHLLLPHPDQFNLEAFLADHARRAMWPGVPPTLVAHPLLGPIGQVDHRQGFKLHRSMSSRAFAALLRDERAYKEDPNHARWKRMNKRAHDVLYGEAGTCTTWDNVVAARSDASKIDDFYGYKASQTTVANKWSCFADSGGTPSAASYTASPGAVMNSASTGAWPLTDPSGSQKKYLLNVFCNHATGTNIVCLVDLLVTIGGIGANTTTATDTSGSPALKRYVDGIGNMMILECTVQLGTTASNVTITYNGTSGNSHSSGALAMTTTPLITFRTDPQSLGGLVTQMASGDAGVKKITAVQFSAAMGAGTVAAHIYRPLVLIPNITAATNWAERPVPNIMGGIQELLVGNSDSSHTAFLTFFVNTSGASTGVQQYYIQTINA